VIKAVKDDPAKVNMYAVARIWRAYCFSRITDVYGDVPYTQAGQGYNLPFSNLSTMRKAPSMRIC
jgi:hypothetical protein